jgi:hypothetical protein
MASRYGGKRMGLPDAKQTVDKKERRMTDMNMSLIASIDDSTRYLKRKIIPLALESLKEAHYVDYAFQASIIARLRGRGYYAPDENVVMSLTFDPKSCGIPFEYCSGDCKGCCHNPLEGLLDPYFTENQFVITCRDTIDTLLDVISLLARANNTSLLREKCAAEIVGD